MGTPELRALRAQYAAMGTPPSNIPPRGNTPMARSGSSGISLVPPSDASVPRPGPQAVGGISAGKGPGTPGSGAETPGLPDLDGLPDEEKLKVLRRHLVSKEERQNRFGEVPADLISNLSVPETTARSRRSSSGEGTSAQVQREDSEPFPIPYHAAGADVT